MTAGETGRPGTSGRLADLTLHVGGYELTCAPPAQLAFRSADAVLPVAGHWSLNTSSPALEQMELFPLRPSPADFRNFRRWAFTSDTHDSALRPGRA
jgi:hypothetical protein